LGSAASLLDTPARTDKKSCKCASLTILKSGYQVVIKYGNDEGKSGSKAKKKRFRTEGRRGHRNSTHRREKILKVEMAKAKKTLASAVKSLNL
jgi:hypothetical protein